MVLVPMVDSLSCMDRRNASRIEDVLIVPFEHPLQNVHETETSGAEVVRFSPSRRSCPATVDIRRALLLEDRLEQSSN